MRFAIFVREGEQTHDKANEIPEQLGKRTIAVRSFDAEGMMVDNRLVDGQQIEPVLEKLLAPSNVDSLHVHFAAAGCYAARVESVNSRRSGTAVGVGSSLAGLPCGRPPDENRWA
jgi:hypothetical protein